MKRLHDSSDDFDPEVEEIFSPSFSPQVFIERTIEWDDVPEDFVPPTFSLIPEPSKPLAPPVRIPPLHVPRVVKAHSPVVREFQNPSYYRRLAGRTRNPQIGSVAVVLLFLSARYVELTCTPYASTIDIDLLSGRCKSFHAHLLTLLDIDRLRYNSSCVDCSHLSDSDLTYECNRDRLLEVYDQLSEDDLDIAVRALLHDPNNFASILDQLLNPPPPCIIISDDDAVSQVDYDDSVYDDTDDL